MGCIKIHGCMTLARVCERTRLLEGAGEGGGGTPGTVPVPTPSPGLAAWGKLTCERVGAKRLRHTSASCSRCSLRGR